jgi:hypothetical protein
MTGQPVKPGHKKEIIDAKSVVSFVDYGDVLRRHGVG